MKEVVHAIPSDRVAVKNVTARKYYGFQFGQGGASSRKKGFITRARFECGSFLLMARESVTEGNGWNSSDIASLMEAVQHAMALGATVYEFDASHQLFGWLA